MTDDLSATLARLAAALEESKPAPELMDTRDLQRFLRCSYCTLSESIICRPDFPAPVQITVHAAGRRWLKADVMRWIESRKRPIRVRRARAKPGAPEILSPPERAN